MENIKLKNFHEHQIEWDDEKISRLWDYYSRTPPYCDVYFSKVYGRHMLRRSGLPLFEQLNVLDFGCGPGFIWEHLNEIGSSWKYTALDFSSDSIEKVSAKGQGHKNFVSAQLVASLPTSFPAMHFDAVLLFEVVEHLNDEHLNGTLNEINRLLKNGGVLVITTPNEEDLMKSKRFCPDCGAIFHEWQHVRSWSVSSLTSVAHSHGFVLRTANALDFNTQALTVRGLANRFMRLARKLIANKKGTPHLIAVYQKA
jgi:SAM-dependent methyltransferase